MINLKKIYKTIRIRLFISLYFAVILMILFFILLNRIVLEKAYVHSKIESLKTAYNKINQFYNENLIETQLEEEISKIAIKNNFEILVKSKDNILLYTSRKDLPISIDKMTEIIGSKEKDLLVMQNMINYNNKNTKNINLYTNNNVVIRKIVNNEKNINYIFLYSKLDNGNILYIRIAVSPIQENVQISNSLLISLGLIAMIFAGIGALFISKRFTKPIMELNEITDKMSRLDFSKKYEENDSEDEINNLGKNINTMSKKLESTIQQLRDTNLELEKDIEEKSKIDEMRKQFISDVSHELKTPIALIQGYAEGLVENVNKDEESRKFYAEVILDEAEKMDVLVKQLLELMKLEYGNREFNDTNFNIMELIQEVMRKCNMMIEEQQIEVICDYEKKIQVFADSFYIEQVLTNYVTNAIKNCIKINGKKQIKIEANETSNNKIRIKVFNTGEKISEEDKERIWKRFYKVDDSRNRDSGGSGIGLSIVKAIMCNYQNEFGVENTENGVEFFFDVNKEETKKQKED